ncbi:MAG: hypothetical protein KAH38_02075 [Candidatus Hydrogenedentes bacterium]|nr:hypothetical protein [Candidatus Hydrogenedentota bacterium]
MLILHELHHIIYGHTRLFRNASIAHNIAFDSIINARLCQTWNSPGYIRFFRKLYKYPLFPEILLCPPLEWDVMEGKSEKIELERTRLIHQVGHEYAGKIIRLRDKLYSYKADVSYQEILDLLRLVSTEIIPVLLGNHNDKENEEQYPDAFESSRILLKMAANELEDNAKEYEKTSGNTSHTGYSTSGSQKTTCILPQQPRKKFLTALKKVFIKSKVYDKKGQGQCPHAATNLQSAVSVIPNPYDRSIYAKEMLLKTPQLLYTTYISTVSTDWERAGITHVYLDVSGSMLQELPWITAALQPLEETGFCRIFTFNIRVTALREKNIRKKVFCGGGTSISPILEHVINTSSQKCPAHIVILTDGDFSLPTQDLMARFLDTKTKIHGAITHRGKKYPLSSIAATMARMPPYL